MIVCASRRTDIPAFHSEWLMNRLREGYCLVRNPVRRDLVHRVGLGPDELDLLVLMTKDPRPMIPHLDELSDMGVPLCFQVTITPYGEDLERNVPDKEDVAEAFRRISARIGRERMVWRYDPVILNDRMDEAYHKEGFGAICRELRGYTGRCVFSTVDIHEKLMPLAEEGTIRRVSASETEGLCRSMSAMAEDSGIGLSCCCPDTDLSHLGIRRGACMDAGHMRSLNIPYTMPRVPLRRGCGCVRSTDIGEYGTCAHGCVYCYAKGHPVRERCDPEGEMLCGGLGEGDTVVRSERRTGRITDHGR